ncbi:12268_t:CDS:1, partial [Dentiscutata heterogama]
KNRKNRPKHCKNIFVDSKENLIQVPTGIIFRDTINNSNVPRGTWNGAESFYDNLEYELCIAVSWP